jgi:hypothetical protein
MAVTSPSHVPTAITARPGRGAKLRAPGWYRAALFDVIGLVFAFGLTTLVRWAMHQHPLIDGHAITIVALFAVPLSFLVGIGCCDYWFYWASGRPTRPAPTRGGTTSASTPTTR